MKKYNRWSFFVVAAFAMPGCFFNGTFQTARVTASVGEEVSQGTGPHLEARSSMDIDVGLQPEEQYVAESAWAEDPGHVDSIRSERPFGVFLGLASIKGIYFGGQYAFAGAKCVQVTLGKVPFVELAGYKASTVSITVNHYFEY